MAKTTRSRKTSAQAEAPLDPATAPAPEVVAAVQPDTAALPDFVPEQLAGQARETILDIFRHRTKAWTKLDEFDQRIVLTSLDNAVKHIIRETVRAAVGADFPTIEVTIVRPIKTTKDDIVEAKVTAPYSEEVLLDFHRQSKVILVLASPSLFYGAADNETKAARDQPDLDLGGKAGDDALTEEQILANLEASNKRAAERKAAEAAGAAPAADVPSLVWTEEPGGVWVFAGVKVKHVKGGAGFEWRADFPDGESYRHIGLPEVKQFVETKIGAAMEADLPPERAREEEPVDA